MGWVYLSVAIIFEVIGTTQLKRTEGNFFTTSGMLMLLFYAISFFMLTQALKNEIEVGVGYAIWSGVGTALIAIIGVTMFHEQASVIKFLCVAMIILGVVGLKLNSDKHVRVQKLERESSSEPMVTERKMRSLSNGENLHSVPKSEPAAVEIAS